MAFSLHNDLEGIVVDESRTVETWRMKSDKITGKSRTLSLIFLPHSKQTCVESFLLALCRFLFSCTLQQVHVQSHFKTLLRTRLQGFV